MHLEEHTVNKYPSLSKVPLDWEEEEDQREAMGLSCWWVLETRAPHPHARPTAGQPPLWNLRTGHPGPLCPGSTQQGGPGFQRRKYCQVKGPWPSLWGRSTGRTLCTLCEQAMQTPRAAWGFQQGTGPWHTVWTNDQGHQQEPDGPPHFKAPWKANLTPGKPWEP